MDADVRKELSSLLEHLTHSGSSTLDPNLTKRLKSLCRSSNTHVRAAYEIIMKNLSEDHAEVRLSSFQVIKELFGRSHLFRELLISDFQKFSSLVAGTDPRSPLPLPKQAAAQLKEKSLLTIREWNDKYGTGYPKLRLGYNYLKTNKKVNFEQLVVQTEVARRRQEERAGRQRAVLEQKIQEVKQEMKDFKRDIEECMTQISSCFNLLMPRFDMPDMYSTAETSGLDPLQAVPEIPSQTGHQEQLANRSNRLSSSSFISLSGTESSDSGSNRMDGLLEPKCVPNQQLVVESICPSSPDQQHSDSEGEDSDSEFLRRHYGISTGGDGVVKGGGSVRGKGKAPFKLSLITPCLKLNMDLNKESQEVPNSHCTHKQSDSESDSDSELEWEDVSPVSTQMSTLDFDMQAHGVATHGFSIPIQLDAVPILREDENNVSILTALRENKRLLTEKYLPIISKWMEWLSKASGEDQSLREAIDLKHRVQLKLDKFERITIIYREPEKREEPIQEVTEVKEGKAQITNPEWQIQPPSSMSTFDLELDPTTPQAQIAKLKKKISMDAANTSKATNSTVPFKKSSLFSKAPVVPFDMDLYHWETPTHQLEPLTKAPVGSLHRFWVQEKEVDISSDEQARLRCRTITYPGIFKPVEKTCRARLPSGKLCPRMDRLKCPFHGPIIPRDENGDPVANSDFQVTQSQTGSGIVQLDQHLQEAIRDAKGAELLQQCKKGKGGKPKIKKHPELTDLKREVDTPRSRLERKVLSKRALKRVAQSVDSANAKKYKDKFGYSFNYALSQ